MSYTTLGQPQGYAYILTNKIREAMISEIVAINTYDFHIRNSNIEELNDLWEHIMDDEKEHFNMFLDLLLKYDPIQYEAYKSAFNHVPIKDQKINPYYDAKPQNQLIFNDIREDMKGELEAVILYEQIVQETPNVFKDVHSAFSKIISDEKEHLSELSIALNRYGVAPAADVNETNTPNNDKY